MAQQPRADTPLSTHSSLADEEIDLEKERQRKRLATKKRFAGAAYATRVVPKQEKDDPTKEEGGHSRPPLKNKTVAGGLAVIGGVAVAGASWTPRNKTKQKVSLKGAATAVTAATAVRKVPRNDLYTIAHALRKAAGVAIAAGSWVPQKRTMKGAGKAAQAMAKAKRAYGQIKEYNIAEGLRIAGGVAVAGASWTKQKSEDNTATLPDQLPILYKPTFVDTACSPIVIDVMESEPPSRQLTPTAVIIATHDTTPTPAPVLGPTPPPSVPANSVDPYTPVILVQPAQDVEDTPTPIVEEEPTPTPAASPTPTPAVVESPAPTPVKPETPPVAEKVVVKEVHREVVRSGRGSRDGIELLAAAAIINRRQDPQPVQAPPPKVETPPPKVETPQPKVETPLPKVETPPPKVATPPPEPKEEAVPSPIVEEPSIPEPTIIALPEEKPVTVANAAAGNKPVKKVKKPLAKLTPLEQLTAKARSLR